VGFLRLWRRNPVDGRAENCCETALNPLPARHYYFPIRSALAHAFDPVNRLKSRQYWFSDDF
jgi:hypothetical protein